MPDREKLIELIGDTYIPIMRGNAEVGRYTILPCEVNAIADRLIANGVTFATDNNVGGKWIPVTERLPKPYVDVITLRWNLLMEEYHSVGIEYISLHGLTNIPVWSKDYMTWKNKVTNWMPLPEPPEGE